MAFYDWNHDGKKDYKDDFMEYQIYKNCKNSKNSKNSNRSKEKDLNRLAAYAERFKVSKVLKRYMEVLL